MVRLTILIVSLLGVFLLNACGTNDVQHPANIDNRDAVFMKERTGQLIGKAQPVLVPEFKENDEVVYNEPKKIFDDVDISVDWESKKVKIKAKIVNNKPGSKAPSQDVLYEGQFNDEGIAYLKPKDSKVKSIAGVRCIEQCASIVTDLGIKHDVDGKMKFEQQQFILHDPNADAQSKAKEEEMEEIIKEIDPVGSNLLPPAQKKADFSGVQGGVVTTAVKVPAKNQPLSKPDKTTKTTTKGATTKTVVAKDTSKGTLQKKQSLNPEKDVEIEMDEPGVPSTLPSVVREDMTDKNESEITLNQYSPSALFPYDLGEKYSGKSLGFYSRYRDKNTHKFSYGSLVKGTDVAVDAKNESEKEIGFLSVDRVDKVYYGSGLLVKTIEEAGKQYAKLTNGDFFEVNDLSKKAGGYASPHSSHQNGLDADILIPKLKNGRNDYGKVWKIIKSFVSLGYVDVIFLEKTRINALCAYLKSSSEKNYSSMFNKLYSEPGHTSHFHVRLKCTEHNIGCLSASYTPTKRGVCH